MFRHKSLFAQVALMWFFTRVYHTMSRQVLLHPEPATTHVAVVRFLSSVYHGVRCQIPATFEWFIAEYAHIASLFFHLKQKRND